MKHILAVLLFLFVCVVPVYAETQPATVDVGTSVTGGAGSGNALIRKVQQMSDSLYKAAIRLIIPIVVGVIIVCGLFGAFVPAARLIAVFALIGMVIVLWAPMLVSAVANWAQ